MIVSEGKDVDDDFINSVPLTKAQKVTVKRRINTLKNTLNRKKNKQNAKTDVRDIFSHQESLPSVCIVIMCLLSLQVCLHTHAHACVQTHTLLYAILISINLHEAYCAWI